MEFEVVIDRDAHDEDVYQIMRKSGMKCGFEESEYDEIEAQFYTEEALILYITAKIKRRG
jgi:hypothetical protein